MRARAWKCHRGDRLCALSVTTLEVDATLAGRALQLPEERRTPGSPRATLPALVLSDDSTARAGCILGHPGLTRAVLILVGVLVGLACERSPKPTAGSKPMLVVPAGATAEKGCLALGGRWEGTTGGRGRLTACSLPTTDAHKSCNDSRECQSVCLAKGAAPRCYEWSQYKGCGILAEGHTICVE